MTPALRQPPPDVVHEAPSAAPRAASPPPRLLRNAAIALAAGLFLALSGAFQTGSAPLQLRLTFWLAIMVAGSLIARLTTHFVLARPWADRLPLFTATCRVGLISVPIGLLAWLLGHVCLGTPLATTTLAAFLIPTLLVSAAMIAISDLADRAPPLTHAAPLPAAPPALAAPPLPPPRPRILDRLPHRLHGARLLAVQAEDHYLRLHTDRGSELVLLRLGDALAELDGIEGAQVHRSWWVARASVQGASRQDGRVSLKLPGNLVAPVSRTYTKALREAGWL